mgnify:CR=1 FL=1
MKIFGKKNDVILILCLIIIGAVLAASFFAIKGMGSYAVITVDGEIVARYSLNKDRTEVISLENGESNTIVICDNSVCVSEATCPDGLCVNMGAISREGQTIVCLPHKLVVSIESRSADDNLEFDGVSN